MDINNLIDNIFCKKKVTIKLIFTKSSVIIKIGVNSKEPRLLLKEDKVMVGPWQLLDKNIRGWLMEFIKYSLSSLYKVSSTILGG